MTRRKLVALLVPLAAIAAVAVMAAGSASAAAKPIVIGWAFDSKGAMAPFDGPALAAAKIRVKQVNAQGRRQGPSAEDHHVRHAGQQAGDREVLRREADRPER